MYLNKLTGEVLRDTNVKTLTCLISIILKFDEVPNFIETNSHKNLGTSINLLNHVPVSSMFNSRV